MRKQDRKDQTVEELVKRYRNNHMFLENLSLYDLRQIQVTTEEFILEEQNSDKISDVLAINERAKEQIAVRKREEQKIARQQEFQSSHKSIFDDILGIIGKLGPESPIGEKKPRKYQEK